MCNGIVHPEVLPPPTEPNKKRQDQKHIVALSKNKYGSEEITCDETTTLSSNSTCVKKQEKGKLDTNEFKGTKERNSGMKKERNESKTKETKRTKPDKTKETEQNK